MKKVVILSGKIGSGKTYVGKALAEYFSGEVISFASPIKQMATLMGWNGLKDKKGRRLLQLLGTECGRECISDDIWIKKAIEQVENTQSELCIFDDARFDNEIKLLREKYSVVHIAIDTPRSRSLFKRFFAHSSERSLTVTPDYVIENDLKTEKAVVDLAYIVWRHFR